MISIYGENTLDKIKQLFVIKSHSRSRIEENFVSLIEEHSHNPIANITFIDNILNVSLSLEIRHIYVSLQLLFNNVLAVSSEQ